MRKYPQLLYIFLIILASPIALSDTWEDMKKCQNQCSLYCQGIFIKGKGKIDKYLTQCGVTAPPLEIEYYRSDYCNGAPEGVFYSTSRCDKLFFNYSIYAIKVNGKCIDILDANIRDAWNSPRILDSFLRRFDKLTYTQRDSYNQVLSVFFSCCTIPQYIQK